jgi:hypothetical protein
MRALAIPAPASEHPKEIKQAQKVDHAPDRPKHLKSPVLPTAPLMKLSIWEFLPRHVQSRGTTDVAAGRKLPAVSA